jgi:hypothetical protein
MSKLKSHAESVSGKCVICLDSYKEDYGKLSCGHLFCLECVKQWWRSHPTCPYCREEILFITTINEELISFEDLPPVEKNEKDEDFIPHCELCWGEIESFEEMNICTMCRSVYWHKRCLPYSSWRWYCIECASHQGGEEDDE